MTYSVTSPVFVQSDTIPQYFISSVMLFVSSMCTIFLHAAGSVCATPSLVCLKALNYFCTMVLVYVCAGDQIFELKICIIWQLYTDSPWQPQLSG